MGLSNGESQKTVFLRLKGMRQEDAYPYLTKSVKKDDKWTTEGEWKSISGQLKSLKFDIKTSEKYGDKEFLSLEIVDDAIYKIDISLASALGRSVVNTLAGSKKVDQIELSFYTQERNGKKYKRVGTRLNGEKQSKWALSVDEQMALTTEIKDPDTGEVIKRKYDNLLNKLKELCKPECNPSAQPSISLEQASASLDSHMNTSFATTESKKEEEEEELDDLPF
jgi:hypothetical protein